MTFQEKLIKGDTDLWESYFINITAESWHLRKNFQSSTVHSDIMWSPLIWIADQLEVWPCLRKQWCFLPMFLLCAWRPEAESSFCYIISEQRPRWFFVSFTLSLAILWIINTQGNSHFYLIFYFICSFWKAYKISYLLVKKGRKKMSSNVTFCFKYYGYQRIFLPWKLHSI